MCFLLGRDGSRVETAQFQGFFVAPHSSRRSCMKRICFRLFSRWFRHASGTTIDLAKGSPMKIECKVNASDGTWSAWSIYIKPSKFTWAKRKCWKIHLYHPLIASWAWAKNCSVIPPFPPPKWYTPLGWCFHKFCSKPEFSSKFLKMTSCYTPQKPTMEKQPFKDSF